MYKYNQPQPTTLEVNNSSKGETIEEKIRRIVNNKEPITDGAPLIYTERKDGTAPEYDIRTDRFEIAVDAMDKISKSHKAKREEKAKVKNIDDAKETKTIDTKTDTGGESTQGTTSTK